MTFTFSVANLKSFIENFLAKAGKCHFHDDLEKWKISIF
jgi:hypothetical protein